MATIKVPKTPKKAFNPQRKASQLLKKQIEHLEWAIRPAAERKPGKMRRIKPVRTEAEAAARTQALMRLLPSASALPIAPAEPARPAASTRAPRPRKRPASKRRPAKATTRRKAR